MSSPVDVVNAEVEMEVKQVTNHFTEIFTSNFTWVVDNYASIPDSWLYTEKVDIPSTRFYWLMQLSPSSQSSHALIKFHIGFRGDTINSNLIDGFSYQVTISNKKSGGALYKGIYTALTPMISFNINDIVTRKNLESYLSENGSLELEVKTCIKRIALLKNVVYRFIDTLSMLSDDFERAMDDDFQDVKFIVESKEIQAHKVILAARSPVFKRMFSTKMKEAQTNHVAISDINFDTFEEMLHYVYTGKTSEKFSIVAMELLAASHKYEIRGLKKLCENEISRNLTEENAGAVFKLAKLYDCDEELKREALQLFKSDAYRKIGALETDDDWDFFPNRTAPETQLKSDSKIEEKEVLSVQLFPPC